MQEAWLADGIHNILLHFPFFLLGQLGMCTYCPSAPLCFCIDIIENEGREGDKPLVHLQISSSKASVKADDKISQGKGLSETPAGERVVVLLQLLASASFFIGHPRVSVTFFGLFPDPNEASATVIVSFLSQAGLL